MGLIARQTIKASAASYVGVVLGYFTIMVLYPYFISKEEIGLLRIVLNAATLFATIGMVGITQVAVKFYPNLLTDRQKDIFGTLIYVLPTLGVLLCYVVFQFLEPWVTEFYKPNAPEIAQYYYLVWWITLLITLYGAGAAYARMNSRIVVPALFKEVGVRFLTIVVFLTFVYSSLTFHQYLNLQILIYSVVFIALLVYNQMLKPFKLNFHLKEIAAPIKGLGAFATLSLLTSAAGMIVITIDTFMIGGMQNLGFVGIYTISSYIGMVIEMPKRSLNAISGPSLSEAWHLKDFKKINELYQKSGLNQFIFGGLALMLIWMNIDDIFSLIPNAEVYRPGKYVVLFIGLAKLIDMAFGLNSEIIAYSPKYYMNLVLLLFLAILAVVSNTLLIPVYGITGAALATMISYFLYNILAFLFLNRNYRLQPFSIKMGLSLLVFIGLTALGYAIDFNFHPLVNILLKSALFTLVFLVIFVKLKLSEDILNLVNSLIKKYIKKS